MFCLFSLIFAILIFHLNRLTLFTSDDFTYHYVYQGYLPTSHPKRIHGILSIIESQINHWKMWNGRFVAHTMVQFILQFKKIYFDIINTLIYLILIWLIILIGKTKEVGKIRPADLYIFGFIFQKLENPFYGFQVHVIICGQVLFILLIFYVLYQ